MGRRLQKIHPKPDRLEEKVISVVQDYRVGINRKVPKVRLIKIVRVKACYKDKNKAWEFWVAPDGRSKFFDAFPDERGYYCVYWYERRIVRRP